MSGAVNSVLVLPVGPAHSGRPSARASHIRAALASALSPLLAHFERMIKDIMWLIRNFDATHGAGPMEATGE